MNITQNEGGSVKSLPTVLVKCEVQLIHESANTALPLIFSVPKKEHHIYTFSVSSSHSLHNWPKLSHTQHLLLYAH